MSFFGLNTLRVSKSAFNTVLRTKTVKLNHNFSSVPTPSYYALFYDYVENILERRTPFRADHLKHANDHVNNGTLVLGGAFADNNVDGALIVFKTTDETLVKQFAENDPYVKNKLVTGYRIRPWTVVAGQNVKM